MNEAKRDEEVYGRVYSCPMVWHGERDRGKLARM
jgi:hypothetical protein